MRNAAAPDRLVLNMDYCFGTGDGSVTAWDEPPNVDMDGDGVLDAVRLDFDGDGLVHAAAGPLLSALSELRLWTEVTASPRNWAELIPMFRAHRSPLLVDHLGGCLAGGQGPLLPDHDTLRRLADLEDVCLKISSVNRISMQREAFSDLDDLVADAVDLFGLDRLVWGSGWPFINQARPVDYTALTDALRRWFPDRDDRHRLIWDTPSRLFGFQRPGSEKRD